MWWWKKQSKPALRISHPKFVLLGRQLCVPTVSGGGLKVYPLVVEYHEVRVGREALTDEQIHRLVEDRKELIINGQT